MLAMALGAMAANSIWSFYFYDTNTGNGGDLGTFQTTSTSNVFLLENVEINYNGTGFQFWIHDSSWSTSYGWYETVANTGQAYTVAAGGGAGWSSLPVGTYDITFNYTNNTVQFDVHSSGGTTTVKKVSILGDSYSTFYGYMTPSDNMSWYSTETTTWYSDNDVTNVDQTWWKQFLNANSDYELLINNSYSGSTMCNSTISGMDVSTSFISRANNLGSPDVILICGGTNDYWNPGLVMGEYKYSAWNDADKTKFRPGFAYLINYIKNNYSDAEVYFILNDMIDGDVYNSIVTICDHYSVPVIAPQGIAKGSSHPTEAGMTTIASAVTEALVNNNYGAGDSWCLTGDFNSWSTTADAFVATDYNPNVFAIDEFSVLSSALDSYGGLGLRITSTDWSSQFQFGTTISTLGAYFTSAAEANTYITAMTGGNKYRVLWDKITHEFSIENGEDEGNKWYMTIGGNSAKFSPTSDSEVFELDNFTVNSLDSSNGFSFLITTTQGASTGYTYNKAMYCVGTYTMNSTSGYAVDRDGTWTQAWSSAYCVALTAGKTYKLTWNKRTHRLSIEESTGSGQVESNLVYVDGNTLKWLADNSEVRLFGANYSLPSANDYRAAGYVGMNTLAQKKAMIDEDLDHFVRLGFDALRVPFYGDYENSDASGNLVENDHLTLLCYLIKQASERNIYIMLTPIVGYDSQWPENDYSSYSDDGGTGFARSSGYGKWQLMYCTETPYTYATTYLTQLLNYNNSFTGNQIKNEPNILLIEIMNEPAYDSNLLTYFSSFTTSYQTAINGYVTAIKGTGCTKPLFFNVSQASLHPSSIVNGSNVDGGTYAWYPFSISNGHKLEGNGLLWTDRYTQLIDITNFPFSKPKVVYEFDGADKCDGYTLPAMTREFRRGGVQFATLYSYDALRTAPYNNTTRTHYFNMVYTPQKAVSAMIAAEVMRQVGAGSTNSYYPSNNTFGDFTLNYEQQLSLLNDGTHYYYSNSTTIQPKAVASIEHIAGCGISPVVDYSGSGIYFLDKEDDNTWTLEIYPDIIEVSDPFKGFESLSDITSPSVVHKSAYNEHDIYINLPSLQASFTLAPGKYTINNGEITESEELAAKDFYQSFQNVSEPSTAVASNTATTITLVKANDDAWTRLNVSGSFSHNYHAPTTSLSLFWDNNTKRNYYYYQVSSLAASGDYSNYNNYPDATLQFFVGDRMTDAFIPTNFTLNAKRMNNDTSKALFLVVDSDGKAWGKEITLSNSYADITVNVSDLTPYKAAMLPQDWPGVNNYWFPASESNTASYTAIDWSKVEFVQISMRKDIYANNSLNKAHGFYLDYITMDGSRCLSIDEDMTVMPQYVPSYYDLTINRSLVPNEWNTICLPIWLTQSQCDWYFGEGTLVAEFTGVKQVNYNFSNEYTNGEVLNIPYELLFSTLTEVNGTYMVANKPYLIKPTKASLASAPVRNSLPRKAQIALENTWVNNYEPEAVTKSDDFTFVGTSVVRDAHQSTYGTVNNLGNLVADPDAASNGTIKATEAYILVDPSISNISDGFSIALDGIRTNVVDLRVATQADDGRIYNIHGQYMGTVLEELPSGIYILNHKKIIK